MKRSRTVKLSAYGYYIGSNSSNVFLIRINDEDFVAYEDEDDGYRSYGKFIPISDSWCTKDDFRITEFPPQEMIMTETTKDYIESTILTDTYTGKDVVTVETENADDYYPIGRCYINPENMYINSNK